MNVKLQQLQDRLRRKFIAETNDFLTHRLPERMEAVTAARYGLRQLRAQRLRFRVAKNCDDSKWLQA